MILDGPLATSGAGIEASEQNEIVTFLIVEARYLDEQRYDEWEALLAEDMFYLIPLNEGEFDPARHASIAADNRRRLGNRLKQLKTGKRYAQDPPSPMRRLLSNVEISRLGDSADEYLVRCNFALFEFRTQSVNELYTWPGRAEYRLRRTQAGLRMFHKRVDLIIASGAIPSLAFIV